MPQPSQFAMGLPVSRFAAMASRLMEKNAPAPRTSKRAKSNAGRDKLMIRFASTATPSIMVEEKGDTPPHRAMSKGTSKETASEGEAAVKVNRRLPLSIKRTDPDLIGEIPFRLVAATIGWFSKSLR